MITLDMLIRINEVICRYSNQESVVINKSNLLSALSVQYWYEDRCELASALIRSLVVGHGFQDGNKRTAACIGMYVQDFECSDTESFECILNIAKGNLKDVKEIASILYPDSYGV